MAVRRKDPPQLNDVLATIGKIVENSVARLWAKHAAEIDELRRDSEKQEVTVNFSVGIDFSESTPDVDVGIRFTETHTDHIRSKLDDPAQGKFSDIVATAEGQPAPTGRRRVVKSGDGE